jgi:hypothetical protein
MLPDGEVPGTIHRHGSVSQKGIITGRNAAGNRFPTELWRRCGEKK